MTTKLITTRFSATKDLRAGTLPLLDTFRVLLDTVEAALRLDLDLSHSLAWDLASTGFAEEAEACWQDGLALARDVVGATPTTVGDLALQRMSLLLHFLIETDNFADAERFQQVMYQNFTLFIAADLAVANALARAGRLVDAIVEAAAPNEHAPLTLR